MPGGDPLATCTLPVGDVYLLTYLLVLENDKPTESAGGGRPAVAVTERWRSRFRA